jgi:hypothetical protein
MGQLTGGALTAPIDRIDSYMIAGGKILHRFANLCYMPGKFMTRDKRQPGSRMKFALENMLITPANTGIINLNKNITIGDHRAINLTPLNNTILAQHRCFHTKLPKSDVSPLHFYRANAEL